MTGNSTVMFTSKEIVSL